MGGLALLNTKDVAKLKKVTVSGVLKAAKNGRLKGWWIENNGSTKKHFVTTVANAKLWDPQSWHHRRARPKTPKTAKGHPDLRSISAQLSHLTERFNSLLERLGEPTDES